MPKTHRVAAHSLVGLATAAIIAFAQAQVPIPVEEQVRLFNSMSPAQQQALIRELERSLPPAQLQAVIRVLQGGVPEANTGSEPQAAPQPPQPQPKDAQ